MTMDDESIMSGGGGRGGPAGILDKRHARACNPGQSHRAHRRRCAWPRQFQSKRGSGAVGVQPSSLKVWGAPASCRLRDV